MSHNPKRPEGLDSAAAAKIASEISRRQPEPAPSRRWRDLYELACWISGRANEGKRVVLSPATATIVALKLAAEHEKPTRDEVALMICQRGEANRCTEPCYTCRGRANIVVQAYGCRLDDPRPHG
ncbi:hypothetical protein [Mesorhizobium sp. 8]|uniref:hypothetical protein n=1 Tax=Mesorhizobium sp. 8 TaxID=2584466 RepID=UPI0011248794|nr:hypothetical protein [Mesorhizobium sp. 8]QDB99688.1 hypothetical protein FGU64_04300 [Mesorhizobium sp. 8]